MPDEIWVGALRHEEHPAPTVEAAGATRASCVALLRRLVLEWDDDAEALSDEDRRVLSEGLGCLERGELDGFGVGEGRRVEVGTVPFAAELGPPPAPPAPASSPDLASREAWAALGAADADASGVALPDWRTRAGFPEGEDDLAPRHRRPWRMRPGDGGTWEFGLSLRLRHPDAPPGSDGEVEVAFEADRGLLAVRLYVPGVAEPAIALKAHPGGLWASVLGDEANDAEPPAWEGAVLPDPDAPGRALPAVACGEAAFRARVGEAAAAEARA